MVLARRKAEWSKAGTIAAAIYNANRAKGARAIKPSDFYKPLDDNQMSWKQAVNLFKEGSKK